MRETLKDQSNRTRCEATHSPLPWEFVRGSRITYDANSEIVDLCHRNNQAYIVKACNEYPKLLQEIEALKTDRAWYERTLKSDRVHRDELLKALESIAAKLGTFEGNCDPNPGELIIEAFETAQKAIGNG